MVNDLRKKKLKLRPVTYLSGSQGSESDIPYGYIWSPHLVPKPKGSCLEIGIDNMIVEFSFYYVKQLLFQSFLRYLGD